MEGAPTSAHVAHYVEIVGDSSQLPPISHAPMLTEPARFGAGGPRTCTHLCRGEARIGMLLTADFEEPASAALVKVGPTLRNRLLLPVVVS